MASLTLVVMAAGIGSRYGGLKQVDPVGPSGEIVLDYAVYDALRAGFDKVVFILRRDIEDLFRERVGRAIERRAEVAYAFQSLDQVPPGFAVPAGRTKPWGTAQAILCARDAVVTPFAAINADDFYGRGAYADMAVELRRPRPAGGPLEFAMAGYVIDNTLSEHGHVARGICAAGPDGCLVDVKERFRIQRFPDGIKDTEDGGKTWVTLPPDSIASMNFWGFTPALFPELAARFPEFLRTIKDPLKSEFLIPEVVGEMVREGRARVKVLPTAEKWFGMTYTDDRPRFQHAVRDLVKKGVYPEKLWAQ